MLQSPVLALPNQVERR